MDTVSNKDRSDAGTRSRVTSSTSKPAPLEGVRIVDLTMFMSGPLTTLMAADLGADVIKVEAIQRLDGWRGVGRGGDRAWEKSGAFNWINRSKRGVTLNLADPRGAALLKRLVAVSDVVVENYTPRVMDNFGLGYEELQAVNPALIMISMPGFGRRGSWRDYTAFAWTTEQMSGICHLTGYPDSGPLFTGTTCGDPLAGLMGGIALMAALNHRRRTGQGQYVDLSQTEAATAFVGDVLTEVQVSGRETPRLGNGNPSMAPHGVYPCRGDRWIAIACTSDEDWGMLWSLMQPSIDGEPVRPRYVSFEERIASRSEIDDRVAAWTGRQDADELMHALQARGIPAGVVMHPSDLLGDPHLRARDFFILQERVGLEPEEYFGQPFRLSDATLPPPRPAPYLGGSNREVLGELLGLSDVELRELEEGLVIGSEPT